MQPYPTGDRVPILLRIPMFPGLEGTARGASKSYRATPANNAIKMSTIRPTSLFGDVAESEGVACASLAGSSYEVVAPTTIQAPCLQAAPMFLARSDILLSFHIPPGKVYEPYHRKLRNILKKILAGDVVEDETVASMRSRCSSCSNVNLRSNWRVPNSVARPTFPSRVEACGG